MARILDIAIQVAWGLHYSHQQRVIHLDVKPGNVLLAFAALQRLTGDRTPHVALFGWLSAPRKAALLKRLHGRIDRIIVWSRGQYSCAVDQLGVPPEKFGGWYADFLRRYYREGFGKKWEGEQRQLVREQAPETVKALEQLPYSILEFMEKHTGRKFQVPFDVQLVFATNLDPAQLVDEAFLRRIPYKIPIGDPSLENFTQIFELNCKRRNLRFHREMVDYLLRRFYTPVKRPLRACQPRDLLDQLLALCQYRRVEAAITPDLLDAAGTAYFLNSREIGLNAEADPDANLGVRQ